MSEIEKLKADNELLRAQLVRCTSCMRYVATEMRNLADGEQAEAELNALAQLLEDTRAEPVTPAKPLIQAAWDDLFAYVRDRKLPKDTLEMAFIAGKLAQALWVMR